MTRRLHVIESARGFRRPHSEQNKRMNTRTRIIAAVLIIVAFLAVTRGVPDDSSFHRCIEDAKAFDQRHQVSNPQPTPFQRCQTNR